MFRAYAPLALVLAGLAACTATTGDESMFILNDTAPPSSGMCTFTGTAGQPFISTGMIDTRSKLGYLFNPLVESQITALMNQVQERTIEVQGANVDLSVQDAGGASVTLPSKDQHFSSLTSGSLAPNGGTANFTFPIVPADAIAAIKAATTNPVTLLATIKVYGSLGGGQVNARPFTYPVTVCTDCLVVDAGPCSASVKPASTNPCQPYQDGMVTCCEGSGGSADLMCP